MGLQMLSMVHNNPGEKPFSTRFNDPGVLADYGCTGHLFRRNAHAAVSFKETGMNLFPHGTPEARWLEKEQINIRQEAARTRAAGLDLMYHVDLFLLPRPLVERMAEDILDGQGRIDLKRPATLELHRLLFEELFDTFPEIDGLIVRVGETYLHDTPWHVGNSAVPYGEDCDAEKEGFVQLLEFLRSEICDRHGRTLIFRTWDCHPDRLHASRDYYLAVTDRIEPHPKLFFSIKHTMLDFWRWVRVNPCIGIGAHRQIVEVQCQREYEGKGAFPDYVMPGVLDGFPENGDGRGLRKMRENPLFAGVYAWPRGGGWFGPYLQSELWCDLNMFVLSRWTRDTERAEHDLFNAFCAERLGIAGRDREKFRELCLLSMDAVLKGRYCEVYDKRLGGGVVPTNIWFRDDRLAGPRLLIGLLEELVARGEAEEAIEEKRQALALWKRIVAIAEELEFPYPELTRAVRVSCLYGQRLFAMILPAWESLVAAIREDRNAFQQAVGQYDEARDAYQALEGEPGCATLFRGVYWALPGEEPEPGLDAAIDSFRGTL